MQVRAMHVGTPLFNGPWISLISVARCHGPSFSGPASFCSIEISQVTNSRLGNFLAFTLASPHEMPSGLPEEGVQA